MNSKGVVYDQWAANFGGSDSRGFWMAGTRSRRRRIPELQFAIVLSEEPEGGFTVTVPSLPGCVTFGRNVRQARLRAREAIECYLESLIKHGEPIPQDNTLSTSVTVGVR